MRIYGTQKCIQYGSHGIQYPHDIDLHTKRKVSVPKQDIGLTIAQALKSQESERERLEEEEEADKKQRAETEKAAIRKAMEERSDAEKRELEVTDLEQQERQRDELQRNQQDDLFKPDFLGKCLL